jgi:cytoskeletal protein CcmA (bactofilin family)
MSEPKQTEKRTLVEEGTQLKGSLTSTCPVLVRGKIEGDVAAPALTVSPSGAVHGKAKVGELYAEGELSGEFDADTVQLSGKVQDRTVIRAKTLSVQLASTTSRLQVVFGECELEVGDPPPPRDVKN